MKIPKDNTTNPDFYFNPSIENIAIDELELDLSTKQNVFSKVSSKNIALVKSEKKTNPIKRLNIFDNYFLQNEQIVTGVSKNEEPNKSLVKPDANQILRSMKVVFRGILEKIPVMNYFVLKEKQNKIKETIMSLDSLNNEVDELINLSVPYGETSDKYKILSENLMKANNINSQIRKEIKD